MVQAIADLLETRTKIVIKMQDNQRQGDSINYLEACLLKIDKALDMILESYDALK